MKFPLLRDMHLICYVLCHAQIYFIGGGAVGAGGSCFIIIYHAWRGVPTDICCATSMIHHVSQSWISCAHPAGLLPLSLQPLCLLAYSPPPGFLNSAGCWQAGGHRGGSSFAKSVGRLLAACKHAWLFAGLPHTLSALPSLQPALPALSTPRPACLEHTKTRASLVHQSCPHPPPSPCGHKAATTPGSTWILGPPHLDPGSSTSNQTNGAAVFMAQQVVQQMLQFGCSAHHTCFFTCFVYCFHSLYLFIITNIHPCVPYITKLLLMALNGRQV